MLRPGFLPAGHLFCKSVSMFICVLLVCLTLSVIWYCIAGNFKFYCFYRFCCCLEINSSEAYDSAVYHESFEAEKFHGNKLYMQIFVKKPWNPTYFLLNLYLNSAIHIKKFCEYAKIVKTVKLFCVETFMVYSI